MFRYDVHIGQRIRHFVTNAPHGKGLSGFARFIGKGNGSVQNLYNSDDVDFKIVLQACEFYGVTLAEFLGINPTENNGIIDLNVTHHDSKDQKLEKLESKVLEILEIIKN